MLTTISEIYFFVIGYPLLTERSHGCYRRGFQQAVDDSSVVVFISIFGRQTHQGRTDGAVFGYFRVVDGSLEDRCVVVSVNYNHDDVEVRGETRLSSITGHHP